MMNHVAVAGWARSQRGGEVKKQILADFDVSNAV
jgi:hypothetical protein